MSLAILLRHSHFLFLGLVLLGCSRGGLASGDTGGAGDAGNPDACDTDGDGHNAARCGGDDCDDMDPARHPGALDVNVRTGPWILEPASAGVDGDLRARPSLAVDASGSAHLSYVLAGLTYATNAGGTWVELAVDPNADGPSSLKLGLDGAAHIAYRTGSGLWYASHAGGSWVTAAIDSQGDGACSLVLDAAGTAHVLYGVGDALRLANNADGTWAISQPESFGSSSPSLALTNTGVLRMSYGGSELYYAQDSDNGWASEVVASGMQHATSLAIDTDGFAHIGYSDVGARYATNRSGKWGIETASESAGPWTTSIAVDAAGAVHMAYDDLNTHYTTNKSGIWQDENLFIGWSGGVALAVDSGGAVHIASSDFLFSEGTFIQYATNRLVELDGIDQNCDGADGIDADGDGHASRATGGDDCNDELAGGFCGGGG